MIPRYLQTLFRDTDLAAFQPEAYPDYAIFRVLEYGDESAVAWLRETFSESDIRRVLCAEHRLSPKSATFWALVYGVLAVADPRDIACMKVSAIASRSTKRDFVDLYVSAARLGLGDILQWFDRKYARTHHNKLHVSEIADLL